MSDLIVFNKPYWVICQFSPHEKHRSLKEFINLPDVYPAGRLDTEYEVALPLHPEFRTLPMVWYVPPLSPVVDQVTASGSDGEDHKVLLSAISQMRIPLEYLAGLFTAGDTAPVELALRRLAAMRSYMRDVFVDNPTNEEIPASVGMTPEKVKEMYRLLSIAKYDDRFVVPTAHPEMPRGIKELEGCPEYYDDEIRRSHL